MLENIDFARGINEYVIPWGTNLIFALLIFVIGRLVAKSIVAVVRKLLVRAKLDDILIHFATSILSAILLVVVIVAALDRLGVDTTSLIAIVGAAGLAIGLALQDSLKNFAAGVMLIVFRPFKAGDFVEAAGTAGTVERIHVFSTIFRTGDNREVTVPNGAIYGGVITNFSSRDTRRVDMVFGIGYGDDLKKAKQVINDILSAEARVLDDPEPVVAVGELADSSVNFVVRPWVKTADYWPVRFDLAERIKLTFDENGISIPYPQMDVHLNKTE
ncbi:MAG: mechanosensitive ion channel [Rhodospirillales bacterium]|nr:mechanosensitive ion channel [Rhodospirillales bacterium]